MDEHCRTTFVWDRQTLCFSMTTLCSMKEMFAKSGAQFLTIKNLEFQDLELLWQCFSAYYEFGDKMKIILDLLEKKANAYASTDK